MDFGEALRLMKEGQKVRREDWVYVGYICIADDGLIRDDENDRYMKMGGLDDDLLAEDWEVAE